MGEKKETEEHLLICLSSSESNEKVIRQGAKLARAFHGKFTALYVETQKNAVLQRKTEKNSIKIFDLPSSWARGL